MLFWHTNMKVTHYQSNAMSFVFTWHNLYASFITISYFSCFCLFVCLFSDCVWKGTVMDIVWSPDRIGAEWRGQALASLDGRCPPWLSVVSITGVHHGFQWFSSQISSIIIRGFHHMCPPWISEMFTIAVRGFNHRCPPYLSLALVKVVHPDSHRVPSGYTYRTNCWNACSKQALSSAILR